MRATRRHPVLHLRADGVTRRRSDTLAGEEPLEIRLGGVPWSVTMRTPGGDFDLVAGFLVSEGLVSEAGQISSLSYGPGVNPDGSPSYNVVEVRLAPGVRGPDPAQARHVYTSSSCGICGTASIEAVTRASRFSVAEDAVRVPLAELLAMPARLREGQQVFDSTGAVHAAALFTLEGDGSSTGDGSATGAGSGTGDGSSTGGGSATGGGSPTLLCLREDVGRHNAVDKVVGWALREGRLPLRGTVLQVSGRASFELVQKARMAGIPVLAAVSGPSSLSVELAREAGMTLVGFSRGDGLNVYTGPERVVAGP